MRSALLALSLLALGVACSRKPAEPADTAVAPGPAPSTDSRDMEGLPERYRDTPSRLIMETYVVSTTGELSEERERSIAKLVLRTMPRGKTWRPTVRKTFGWKDEVDGLILSNWDRYKAARAKANEPVNVDEFAKIFVDEIILKAGNHGASPPAATPSPGVMATAPMPKSGSAAAH